MYLVINITDMSFSDGYDSNLSYSVAVFRSDDLNNNRYTNNLQIDLGSILINTTNTDLYQAIGNQVYENFIYTLNLNYEIVDYMFIGKQLCGPFRYTFKKIKD